MSHSQGNGKIYEELRGYFPPEYDLTPDELEKEIELENKKREIALGMMRAHLTEDTSEKAEPFTPKSKSLNASAGSDHPAQAKKDTKVPAAEHTSPEETFVTELMQDEPDEAAEAEIKEDAVEVIPEIEEDEAPDFTEDEASYTDDTESLDELFYALEADDETDESTTDGEATESTFRKNVSWLFDFLEVFAICITCIIIIFATFFRLTKVSGESMEDTLFENEYLIVSDLFYEPECGDIVVIQNTSLENDLLKEPLVKRVIATEGQTVDIALNGAVIVTDKDGNSRVLDQSFTKDEPYAGTSGHFEVPEGCVFVMGDNRNHSTDSRSPMVSYVDERCIFGKAILRVLPFTEFTVFQNPYNN